MLARVPIRLRLTIWYVLLLALILAAFAGGVYLLLRHNLNQNLNDSIQNRAGGRFSTSSSLKGTVRCCRDKGLPETQRRRSISLASSTLQVR